MGVFLPMVVGGDIKAPEGYEQIINYTMLYGEGIEGETAGVWGKDGYAMSGYTINQGTKNADNLYMKVTGDAAISMFGTANRITLDEYSLLGFVNIANDTGGEGKGIFKTFIPNKSDMKSERVLNGYLGENANKTLVTESVADITGSYYLAMWAPSSSGYTRSGYIYNIFLTKPDDINTLCIKAGVTPTSLATLLTDTASLTAIFNNEDAVNYMVAQCTGDFMVGVLSSPYCVGLLSESPYLNTVVGNPHWAKFMMMIPTAKSLLNYTMPYDEGDECTDITGGWKTVENAPSDKSTFTKNADNLQIVSPRYGNAFYVNGNALDFSNYNNLFVVGKNTGDRHFVQIRTGGTYEYEELKGLQSPFLTSKSTGVLDISDINESAYVFLINAPIETNSNITLNIYNAFLTKADDYQTLCTIAGVTPTDLATLVADANAMSTIMSNEKAVTYLMGCTGDLMVSICNSEVAMNALVSNIAYDYAFRHPVWYKFMTMIPTALSAMDSVAVTVPTMTSNTAPSGEASASTAYNANTAAYKAFDGILPPEDNSWSGANSGTAVGSWIGYKWESEKINLYKVVIHPRYLSGYLGNYLPTQFKVQGSNDGSDWVDIETFEGKTTSKQTSAFADTYIISNTEQAFQYIRIYVTGAPTSGTTQENLSVGEIEFYGKAVD